MRRRGTWLRRTAILLVLVAGFRAEAQESDTTRRAAELATEAAARYQQGDVQGAIDLFHEAMSYVPDPAFAFNLAQLYDSIHQEPLAYRFYQRYLELYPGAPNRSEVEERIAVLLDLFSRDYAHLMVRTSPAGARIVVDLEGRSFDYGPSPVDNYVVEGMVTISAELEGYVSASTTRNAVAGVRLEVSFELYPLEVTETPPPAESTPPVSAPPPEPEGTAVLPIVGWTLVALGAGLTGAGVYFWWDASDKEGDHNDYVRQLRSGEPIPLTLNELRQLGNDAEDSATLGNLLGIPGVIVLAGGVTILLIEYLSNGEPANGSMAGPLLFPNGLGVGLTGRF